MAEGKPIFRIDELIEALLKGSPSDPVYLQVGSKKYGIDKIETGVIRVKSGKKTQDAETVVQTLRRFATGAPKEEETGVAWRIVGVGGGTAIRSVKYEGGKIIVRTLANEGKGRAAESFEAECWSCGQDHNTDKADMLSCSKGYDHVVCSDKECKTAHNQDCGMCWKCGTTLVECVGCKHEGKTMGDYMRCPECAERGGEDDPHLGWFCCSECWDENTVTMTELSAESFEAEVICITCDRGFPPQNGIRRAQGWECLACSKGESWGGETFAAPLVCPGCSADLIQVREYSVTVCKDCGRQLTEQDYYNEEHWGETPPLKQDELDAEGEPDRGSGKCVCGVNCVCECGCAETGVCNCGDVCPCDCGCGVKNAEEFDPKGHRNWGIENESTGRAKCKVCGQSILKGQKSVFLYGAGYGRKQVHSDPADCSQLRNAEDDSPTYTPEAYDPLTESPTDYDPKAKTFAAASKRKSKRRRKSDKRRAATPAKRAWNNKVSTKISTIMADYEKTGKIGNSRPKNKAAAMKQAIAVAYSICAREYKKGGKRLPAGIKAAEGEKSRPFR